MIRNESLPIINSYPNASLNVSDIEYDCFFKLDKGIGGYHVVSVQNFSHLIDLGLATFNLSALFGSIKFNENNTILFSVNFAQNTNSFQYGSAIDSK